jgi:ribosome-binding protein aMBF1 (putative translation factor)
MKTKNAIEILKHRFAKKTALKKAYEEEKLNFQIACLIRESREAAGLTQAQLAALIHTKQSVISRVEDADYGGHSLTMLQKIATSLNKILVLNFEKRRAA